MATAAALARRGVRTQRGQVLQKALGQHLLVNKETLRRIVDSAEVLPTEHVLEVGPGTGNLTVLLLERAAAVTAVELDEDLHAMLESRVQRIGLSQRLHAIRGDFLSVPLPKSDAMVANVPYQISSPLLARLFAMPAAVAPDRCVLLLQKEFADRMVAGPGSSNYSRLSVTCSLFADVEPAFDVPRTHFKPPPKVESAVVVVRPRPDRAAAAGVDFNRFNSMLRECFAGKNKTLRSLLLKPSAVRRALFRASPDGGHPNRRATSKTRSGVGEEEHAEMRERLDRSLVLSGLHDARPNAMPLSAFMDLYGASLEQGVVWGAGEGTEAEAADEDDSRS